MSTFARLRELLSLGPSHQNWDTLINVLENWEDEDDKELALEYTRQHVLQWPTDLRRLIEPHPQHSCWSLAGRVHWKGGTHTSLEALPLTQLKQYTNIVELELFDWDHIQEASIFKELPHLEHINLTNCNQLLYISGCSQLPNLRHLAINECPVFQGCSDATPYPALRELKLIGCTHLEEFHAEHYPSLERLWVSKNAAIRALDLKQLSALTYVNINDCNHIRRLSIRGLKDITFLSTSHSNPELQIQGLEALSNLQTLLLHNYPECEKKASDFSDLQHMEKLETLIIERTSVEGFGGLSNLQKLKKLQVEAFYNVESIDDALYSIPYLEVLNLKRGTFVREIDLTPLKNLQYLLLRELESLESIKGLEASSQLSTLVVVDCNELEEPHLFSVADLRLFERETIAELQKSLQK